MKLYKKVYRKEVYEPSVQLVDVTCDICGKSCDVAAFPGQKSFEYATLSASWGYGSNKDGDTHECIICTHCFDKLPFRDKIRVVNSCFGGPGVCDEQEEEETHE
jgi:predicted aldo/keto reductase-like oxidoreductase